MTRDVIYRPAVKQDCPRLGEFISMAAGGVLEFLLGGLAPRVTPVQMVAHELAQDKNHRTFRNVTVAEAGGEAVGMAFCYPAVFHRVTEDAKAFIPSDRLEHLAGLYEAAVEGSLYLDALSVDQAFRGRGIGGRLLETVKDKAVALGMDSISLLVFADNAGARRLYERHGFLVVGNAPIKRHRLIPHDGGCFVMEKKIVQAQSLGAGGK